MAKIDWRNAFSRVSRQRLSSGDFDRVVDYLRCWDGWNVMHEDGFITRVEDDDEDGIWDEDWDDPREFPMYFSDRLIKGLNKTFEFKTPTFVGNATKLPIPGDAPLSSSKGVAPSSSF